MLRQYRVLMTAHGVGPSMRPTENWEHRLLHGTPSGTEPQAYTKCVYKQGGEQHASQPKPKTKDPNEGKQRRDIDKWVGSPFSGNYDASLSDLAS